MFFRRTSDAARPRRMTMMTTTMRRMSELLGDGVAVSSSSSSSRFTTNRREFTNRSYCCSLYTTSAAASSGEQDHESDDDKNNATKRMTQLTEDSKDKDNDNDNNNNVTQIENPNENAWRRMLREADELVLPPALRLKILVSSSSSSSLISNVPAKAIVRETNRLTSRKGSYNDINSEYIINNNNHENNGKNSMELPKHFEKAVKKAIQSEGSSNKQLARKGKHLLDYTSNLFRISRLLLLPLLLPLLILLLLPLLQHYFYLHDIQFCFLIFFVFWLLL